jgi:hypothetical protein
MKNTEPTASNYEQLKQALEKMEEIVSAINEKKRESEMQQKVFELTQKLIGAEV